MEEREGEEIEKAAKEKAAGAWSQTPDRARETVERAQLAPL